MLSIQRHQNVHACLKRGCQNVPIFIYSQFCPSLFLGKRWLLTDFNLRGTQQQIEPLLRRSIHLKSYISLCLLKYDTACYQNKQKCLCQQNNG